MDETGTQTQDFPKVLWEANGHRIVVDAEGLFVERKCYDAMGGVSWRGMDREDLWQISRFARALAACLLDMPEGDVGI